MSYRDYDKVILIHIPRTGGNSMRYTLEKVVPNFISSGHQYLQDVHKTYPNSFLFSIVRNPYTRLISWYNLHKFLNKGKEYKYPDTFQEWALADEFRTHWEEADTLISDPLLLWKYLTLDGETISSKVFIIKNEEYDKGYDYLMDFIGVKKIPLEFYSSTDRPSSDSYESYKKSGKIKKGIVHYYNREILDLVNTRFRKDFEFFNYQMI